MALKKSISIKSNNLFSKKRFMCLSMTCVMLAGSFVLTGCSNGQDGKDGKDGLSGTIWKSGASYTEFADAKEGDYYIDTDDLILYKKTKNDWVVIIENYDYKVPSVTINSAGRWVIDGVATDYVAVATDGKTPYIHTDGFWYIDGESTGIKASGNSGTPGKSAFDLFKEENPNFKGALQDWFDTLKGTPGKSAFDLFKEENPNFKGTLQDWLDTLEGTPGKDGQAWSIGINYPTNSNVGDMFLNNLTWEVYQYNGTEWILMGNIKGEPGNTPKIEFDKDGYIIIDGVKSDICIYTSETPKDIAYNSSTLSNYEYKVVQGNALQTAGSAMSNRTSIWFNYKFKAGTKFKLVGDLSLYAAGFSISRNGREFDGRLYPEQAEDTGWISSSTASGNLNVGGSSINHQYDKNTKTLTLSQDSYVRINFKALDDSNINTTTYDWANFIEINGIYLEQSKSLHVTTDSGKREVIDYGMNSVAHRGYSTIAPENTLSAYRLAKEKGFDMAECDVTFTSDGVGVLLHDDTIDRTSNGTGKISNMTLEQVRQYDFGSWKSTDYYGEKIPTFEEFINLCKYLSIHPYIEIKGGASKENVEGLVEIVRRAGMLDKVTWISFDINMLIYVDGKDDTARLGYLATKVTEQKISELKALRSDKNEVFFNADNTNVTEAIVERCIEEFIPLEVCTIDDINVIQNLHPYISGVTSNDKIAGKILYDKYQN